MTVKKTVKSALLISALSASLQAHAALSLDRIIVYFEPDELPRQDMLVTNPDPENLYLQTEVYNVINPGTDKEEQVLATDPSQIKLLATPAKSVIPPNSRKTVRLVSLEKPKDKEAVYRVTFRPVVGEQEATQSGVKILIAYQALIFVRPDNPAYNVSARVEGDRVVFSNSGNMHAVLRNGQYCQNDNPESCTPLADTGRVYARESWTMPLPEGAAKGKGYIDYGLFDGEFEETQRFTL